MIFKFLVVFLLCVIAGKINSVGVEINKNRDAIYYFIDKIKEMKNENK